MIDKIEVISLATGIFGGVGFIALPGEGNPAFREMWSLLSRLLRGAVLRIAQKKGS